MRIAIDFTSFIPQMTGVDTYMKQLVWNLAKIDRINQYRIYHNYEDRRLFGAGLPLNVSHCIPLLTEYAAKTSSPARTTSVAACGCVRLGRGRSAFSLVHHALSARDGATCVDGS